MARLRNRIRKADYFTDGELLRWHRDKRATYSGLWAMAEDSGVVEDDPFEWKCSLWPSPLDADITPDVLAGWRDELVAAGKLVPFEADGKRYLYIRSFHQHEQPRNPQQPDLPLPPWVTIVSKDGVSKDGKRWQRTRYEVDEESVPGRNGHCTASVQTADGLRTDSVQTPYGDGMDSVQTPNGLSTNSPALPCPALPCPKVKESLSESAGASSAVAVDKSSGKLKRKTAEEWQAEHDELFGHLRWPDEVAQLVDLLASENKTGTVAVSRVVRELLTPILALQDDDAITDEALRYGLLAAIRAGAPNANYVKRAANGYATRPQPAGGNGRKTADDIMADALAAGLDWKDFE